jgi:hypothetical protein
LLGHLVAGFLVKTSGFYFPTSSINAKARFPILHKTRFPAIEEVQQWDSEVFTVRDEMTRDEMTLRRNDPRRNDPRRNGCDEMTRDKMPGDEITRSRELGRARAAADVEVVDVQGSDGES